MVNHGTLVKIIARPWQNLDKITMVSHGSYRGYHTKNSIEPFSVIDRVPNWKVYRHVFECVETRNTMVTGNIVQGITSRCKTEITEITSKAASGNTDVDKDAFEHWELPKKGFFGTMVSLPRSWQDLGKASKKIAMDLGKDTMALDTHSITPQH